MNFHTLFRRRQDSPAAPALPPDFDGMVEPDERDVSFDGSPASEECEGRRISGSASSGCRSPEDGVRQNLATTGHPAKLPQRVEGEVEDTIPLFLSRIDDTSRLAVKPG